MIIKPENHHKKMFYESYVNIIYGLNICVHLRSFAEKELLTVHQVTINLVSSKASLVNAPDNQ